MPPNNMPPNKINLRELIKGYISLTKPGILVLLLISTACPMFLAAVSTGAASSSFTSNSFLEHPAAIVLTASFWSTLCWTLLGGALFSASASVCNCIWDKDIDTIMERTKHRPLPQGIISNFQALVFATVLLLAGIGVFVIKINYLSMWISLAGHLFYVIIYSMILKRNTAQNIVIGGAAGAVPPIVGWAAVTNTISWEAILLFLVIFLWTPPHFWALALNKNQDYQRANIPMMPLTAGPQSTINQMLVYAMLLLPASLAIIWINKTLGLFSLLSYFVLNSIFIWKIVVLKKLTQDPTLYAKQSWLVFWFPIIYLGLFFFYLTLGLFSLLSYLVLSLIFIWKIIALKKLTQDPTLSTKQSWSVFWFSIIYLGLFFFCLVIDSVII